MKKLVTTVALATLMGFSFASVSIAATAKPEATTVTTTTTTADHQADKKDAEANQSSGLADSAKKYWNKFIDVFTGPATNK
jgi:hypothetical protein